MKARQKLVNEAKPKLLIEGRVLLDEWLGQMGMALGAVPEVEDPDARKYWGIALAGNLLWALSSAMAPELRIAMIATSIVGAAVGSGVVEKLANEPKSSGKEIVMRRLDEARNNMESALPGLVIEALVTIAESDVGDAPAQTKILWGIIFPGIAFEKRFTEMGDVALKEINGALVNFMDQYEAWRDLIQKIVTEDIFERHEFSSRDEIEKQHPFTPNLKFGVPRATTKNFIYNYIKLGASRKKAENQ